MLFKTVAASTEHLHPILRRRGKGGLPEKMGVPELFSVFNLDTGTSTRMPIIHVMLPGYSATSLPCLHPQSHTSQNTYLYPIAHLLLPGHSGRLTRTTGYLEQQNPNFIIVSGHPPIRIFGICMDNTETAWGILGQAPVNVQNNTPLLVGIPLR